ncbi:hypothetical protein C8R46DRAFT_1066801 [Mycena filopes]|nr:hypothetical protein C8R46DRAFT_1066801 [Mycena filopes]
MAHHRGQNSNKEDAKEMATIIFSTIRDLGEIRRPPGFDLDAWIDLPLPRSDIRNDWIAEGRVRFGGAVSRVIHQQLGSDSEILVSGFESSTTWEAIVKPPTGTLLLRALKLAALPPLDSEDTFFMWIYHFSIMDGPFGNMPKVQNWVYQQLAPALLEVYDVSNRISTTRNFKNHARTAPFEQLKRNLDINLTRSED